MANLIAACIMILLSIIFASQVLLEYYVHITDMASDAYNKTIHPWYIASNKVSSEEI